MRHAETESYILGKGRVESALGSVGVESRETDTGDMTGTSATATGFCAHDKMEQSPFEPYW